MTLCPECGKAMSEYTQEALLPGRPDRHMVECRNDAGQCAFAWQTCVLEDLTTQYSLLAGIARARARAEAREAAAV